MLTMPKPTTDREDATLSRQESADDNLRGRMQNDTRINQRQMESRPNRMSFRSYVESQKRPPLDTYQLQWLWSKYVATDL